MPKVNNIRRKLASHGYVRNERLCKEPQCNSHVDSKSGKSYTHGITGCDYWVDCIGTGRDIRYSWGADGKDWVPSMTVLSKKKTLTDPGQKLKTWLDENYFGKVPHGYRKAALSEIEKLDLHGETAGSISKTITLSRLGR